MLTPCIYRQPSPTIANHRQSSPIIANHRQSIRGFKYGAPRLEPEDLPENYDVLRVSGGVGRVWPVCGWCVAGVWLAYGSCIVRMGCEIWGTQVGPPRYTVSSLTQLDSTYLTHSLWHLTAHVPHPIPSIVFYYRGWT